MRKTLVFIALATVLALGLAACGSSSSTGASGSSSSAVSADSSQSAESASSEPTAQVYKIGETATVGDFKLTVTNVDFAKRLGNWPDGEHFMLPDDSDDHRYSNKTPWEADDGKSILYATAVLEYTGDTKEDIPLSMAFSADYKGEYHFDETNTNNGLGYNVAIWSNDDELGHFHYGHTVNEETKFEPLSSDNTRQIRCCVPVPEVVAADESGELILNYDLIFTDNWISGTDYSNYDHDRVSFKVR